MDIALNGSAAYVHLTLTNARTDIGPLDQFGVTQELPASFFRGDYCRLFMYNGTVPFSGAPVNEIVATYPANDYLPTERWAAFVNHDGSAGVGVWTPALTNVGVAHYVSSNGSDSCVGAPGDDAAGYIAPWQYEVLDASIVYAYDFALVLGTVPQIRAFAAARHAEGRDAPALPQYVFGPTRGRCWYAGGLVDSGWPVPHDGVLLALDAVPNGLGLVVGPHEAWLAADAPAVYVNGSFPSGTFVAILFEQYGTPQPCDACAVVSAPARGGGFEVLRIDLSSNANYAGRMQRLILRPTLVQGPPGARAQLRSISAQGQ